MNNYILVKVVGKNVNNYLKWLLKNKINIIHLDIIKHNELNLIVDYKYYKSLKKYSKTYKITILKKYGRLRLFDTIKNNIVIIISLMLSIIFLYLLSNIIFSIDIMYNDKEIVDMINKELIKYDIKKYRFKKSYAYLNKVKLQILKDNKDSLEWLEIEESGTKYIIKLVERKKESKIKEYMYQSIVARKAATIVDIKAYTGEKTKQINEYVKKGDVIISGVLTKPDGTNLYMRAKGIVTAEVWYKVTAEYPLFYQEEKVTGRSKNVISIYFLNREIPLFPYKKYKKFRKLSHIIIEDNFIPFKISKEKFYEVNIKEDIYTSEEATEKAIEEAVKKMQIQNNKIIKINQTLILKKENLNSKIKVNLFISAIEDITEISEVKYDENAEIVEN